MKRCFLSRVRVGQKFWLFSSDADNDYFIRGPFQRSLRRYVCWIRGDVLTYVHGRVPVYVKD